MMNRLKLAKTMIKADLVKVRRNSSYDVFRLIYENIGKDISGSLSLLSTISLFCGGLIFFLYFRDIEYTPRLDFSSTFALFFAAAISGFLIIVFYSFLFAYPGIQWFILYQSMNGSEDRSEIFTDFFYCFFWPITLFFTGWKKLKNKKIKNLLFESVYSIFIGQLFGGALVLFIYTDKFQKDISLIIIISVCFGALFASFGCNLGVLKFLCDDKISGNMGKAYEWSILIGFFLFGLGIFAIFPKHVPPIIMANFGWGNIDKASIVFNQKGCSIIEKVNNDLCTVLEMTEKQKADKKIKKVGDNLTEEIISTKESAETVYRIDNIKILLALGENYYLEVPVLPSKNNDTRESKSASEEKIIIPKDYVLSLIK